MTADQLHANIRKKKSCLCIGLDTDPERIPDQFRHSEFPRYEFNKQIVDNTHDLVIAFKPNLAFYEVSGASGWQELEMTCRYLKKKYPEILLIADGKRGDIGNTSGMYARALFDHLGCDAVTVSPYMGRDSLEPFMRPGKWTIVLALTSNRGSVDFQTLELGGRDFMLFEEVIHRSSGWGSPDNLMYVVGATQTDSLKQIRKIIPDHFMLIPGIGAQGGDLHDVMHSGCNDRVGLIINASRSVLYAGEGGEFARMARSRALELQQTMQSILEELDLI